jgi:ABC-type transport system involved in multi-copper enzyme maturation permease subunit
VAAIQHCLTWFRHTFGWSNSRQSWQERIVLLLFLASAIGVWLASGYVRLWQGAILWLLWAAAAAVATRLGELKLFGPVLFYDMICTSRRNRYFILRMLYAGFLVFVLFSMFANDSWSNRGRREADARLAENFFETFVVIQFVMIALLTPAYVAGSIAEEKDRKTLEFLLATDLNNHEIVLSKLGSRLANMVLFLLTGLPILGLLQFLGGVDPDLVVVTFAATGVTMLSVASVGILMSVFFNKAWNAIISNYLVLITFFLVTAFLYGLVEGRWWLMAESIDLGFTSFTVGDVAKVLYAGNPIPLVVAIYGAGSRGTLAAELPDLLRGYAAFHVVVSALCLLWSITRIRALALTQASGGKASKEKWAHRYRPPVGDLPIIWKELFAEGGLRLNWFLWITVLLLVALSVGTGVYIAGYVVLNGGFRGDPWRDLAESMNIWVRVAGTSVACLNLLAVAIRASTSISGERDRDTLDALLATPMGSDDILVGKLLGSIVSVRLGWFWIGAMLALALLCGGINLLAVPLFIVSWLVYAVFFAMLGMWFSIVCKTTLRATVTTVIASLMVGGGHWLIWICCGPLLFFSGMRGGGDMPEYFLKFQAGMSPPFVMGLFLFSTLDLTEHFNNSREFGEFFAFGLIGVFLWAIACFVMWHGFIVPRFRHMTRREELFYPEQDEPRRKKPRAEPLVEPTLVEPTLVEPTLVEEAPPPDGIRE